MTERPPLIDHIGWDLTRAARSWKARYQREMVARGYAFFGEARGDLIGRIPRDGVSQAEIAAATGLTKQAVQQQIDLLVEDGIVERQADKQDKRRKSVVFTKKGHAALAEGNEVKKAIEAEVAERLGPKAFR